MRRRQLLAASAGLVAGLAGCGSQSETPGTGDDDGDEGTTTPTADTPANGPQERDENLPDAVGLETVADGLEAPLDVAFAPAADRRYVAEQPGTVRVHEPDRLRSAPLLDLTDRVVTGFETGLLGIALHPSFADNRRLFVRYSAPPREGTPDSYSHTFVLAEVRVSADGRSVVADSERTVLEIPQPQGNHNAGSIVFGPEGYLYVGVGDGGAGGDQGTGHADDWYDGVDGGNGQDVTENLLGSILRIDVDGREDGTGYAVPTDNPLVGREGLDEHYAWGLRNPWRLAFDGDDLYAGDVGQSRFEEVDLIERGGNYGWNVTEGTHCFGADGCPDATPGDVRDGERFVDPVIEYPHSGAPVSGISVITGNVYRGSALPGLKDRYVFGDFRAGGELFVATPGGEDEEGLWPTSVLPIRERDAGKLGQLLSVGRDDGELFVLGVGQTGGLYRIVADA
jgi:glucose/arabinose dehydrogenase